MKKIVILNGIHGSGKSTIGRQLERIDSKFKYFPEIGGELRRKVSYNALELGMGFDRKVMGLEFKRDSQIVKCSKIPLIETWHIGNLAYTAIRSPELYLPYKKKLIKSLKIFIPHAILLEIDKKTFRMRMSEKISKSQFDDLLFFYQQINIWIKELYKELNIEFDTVISNNALGNVVKEVLIKLDDKSDK